MRRLSARLKFISHPSMGGTGVLPLSRCGNPLLLFILLVHLSEYCHGSTYYTLYDIRSDRICNRYSKREVQVTMSKPIILELTSSHAVTSGSSMPVSCDYEVEGRGGVRVGVASVVQRMGFRSQAEACVDYIQRVYKSVKGFKVKKHKDKFKSKVLKKAIKKGMGHLVKKRDTDEQYRGARVCGQVVFGLHVSDQNETLPPPFANALPPTPPRDTFLSISSFSDNNINPWGSVVSDAADADPKGEMKTHLFISNRPLRVGEEPLKLMIVYTAFQECDGRRVPEYQFHCGYGLCISSALVNDGIVNCPFGDCVDETSCTIAKNANITAHVTRYTPYSTSSGGESGGTIAGLVTFLAISGCIAFCVFYCCKKRRAQKSATPQPATEDDGGEFADPSKQPQPNTYYPTQPPAQQPGYPPPGGQPGYYPMVPQQPLPPPGYTPQPGQQPAAGYPGYPGQPPAAGYPGQPQTGGYPGQPPPAAGYPGPPQTPGYPGQPPNNATGAPYPGQAPAYPPSTPAAAPGYPPTQPDQQAPTGTIGFNVPPPLPTGGYPPAPTPGAPSEAPTAPPA